VKVDGRTGILGALHAPIDPTISPTTMGAFEPPHDIRAILSVERDALEAPSSFNSSMTTPEREALAVD
jgi:hypothetical protein